MIFLTIIEGSMEMDILFMILKDLWFFIALCGIIVCAVIYMKKKYTKPPSKQAHSKDHDQSVNYSIAFGPLVGLLFSMLLSFFIDLPMLTMITIGPGIGLLCGIIAHEIGWFKKERNIES